MKLEIGTYGAQEPERAYEGWIGIGADFTIYIRLDGSLDVQAADQAKVRVMGPPAEFASRGKLTERR